MIVACPPFAMYAVVLCLVSAVTVAPAPASAPTSARFALPFASFVAVALTVSDAAETFAFDPR